MYHLATKHPQKNEPTKQVGTLLCRFVFWGCFVARQYIWIIIIIIIY